MLASRLLGMRCPLILWFPAFAAFVAETGLHFQLMICIVISEIFAG